MSSNPLGALLGSLLGGAGGQQGGSGGGAGGLLGSLLNALGGAQGGQGGQGAPGQQSNPLGSLFGLVDSKVAPDDAVREKAQSWVGSGANQELTPDEVTRLVPSDALHQAATEHGLSDEQAADEIARSLPQAVDRATPNGREDLQRPLEDVANEVLPGGWGQQNAA